MSTIFQYMKAAKRRRITRSSKRINANEEDSIPKFDLTFNETFSGKHGNKGEPEPLGYFSHFPTEVFYHILFLSPLNVLGRLSQTSSVVRDTILEFIESKRAISRIVPSVPKIKDGESEVTKEDQLHSHYKDLAILMKKCTCLFPTNERLRQVGGILNKLRDSHVLICHQYGSNHAYSCYGEFLHTFIAGWEDEEKAKAFIAIQGASLLQRRVTDVLKGGLDDEERERFEWYIRVFCRELFIDRAEKSEKSFWLFQILGNLNHGDQARLLYVIFGPQAYDIELNEHYIDWRAFMDDPAPTTDLKALASILRSLADDGRGLWKSDKIIKMFNKLIEFPSRWHVENVSKLLRLSGKKLCYSIIDKIASSGKFHELSLRLCHLWQFSISEEGSMNSNDDNNFWFLSLLKHLSSLKLKKKKSSELFDYFLSIFEDNVALDIMEHRFTTDSDVEETEDVVKDQLKPITLLLRALLKQYLSL